MIKKIFTRTLFLSAVIIALNLIVLHNNFVDSVDSVSAATIKNTPKPTSTPIVTPKPVATPTPIVTPKPTAIVTAKPTATPIPTKAPIITPTPQVEMIDQFSDVEKNAWYAQAISALSDQGIINGNGKGYFLPKANIKRADFIVMVMRAFKIEPVKGISVNFSDVGNTYYRDYIGTAQSLKIIEGLAGGYFQPESAISRQDMAVILYRAMREMALLPDNANLYQYNAYQDQADIAQYATNSMKFFAEMGWITGNGHELLPKNTTTRAEVAKILYGIIENPTVKGKINGLVQPTSTPIPSPTLTPGDLTIIETISPVVTPEVYDDDDDYEDD